METIIENLDGKPLILKMADFDSEFDVDDMTRIHYENVYGDAVTVSALLNKVGILKSHAESIFNLKTLESKIYESELRKQFRREAADNAGRIKIGEESFKFTEKTLDDAVILDKVWQIKQKNVFLAQANLGKIDSFYWSVQSKDKKLNNLIVGVTEEQLWNELVESKINGILIKKGKSITERRARK